MISAGTPSFAKIPVVSPAAPATVMPALPMTLLLPVLPAKLPVQKRARSLSDMVFASSAALESITGCTGMISEMTDAFSFRTGTVSGIAIVFLLSGFQSAKSG